MARTPRNPRDPAPPVGRTPRKSREPAPPRSWRVEFDWRGESAYYVEGNRRVWLECIYWGGPAGRVSHIHGYWHYDDGRSEPLTNDERSLVLERVIEAAQTDHHITLEVARG